MNSSTARSIPKRPAPLSLTPPNGICGLVVDRLIVDVHDAGVRAAGQIEATVRAPVMSPAVSPNPEALARRSASSAPSASSSSTTGPNVAGTPAFAEEIFDPVAPVIRFAGTGEAVRLATASEYGLSLGIITRDVMRGLALADRIPTGIVHINDQTVSDEANSPFGGGAASATGSRFGGAASATGSRFGGAASATGSQFGGAASATGSRFGGAASGTGSRFGGAAADVEAFTETRWVTVRDRPPAYPF